MNGKARLVPLDLVRGLAVIVMSIDHASKVFNAGRINTDSALRWIPGSALPMEQFLTRWVTHFCAPAFVLLAGVALALSSERRLRRGDTAAEVDGHLRKRGALLLFIELVWMSPAMLAPGSLLFQVLFALGTSILAMSWLRRLSDRTLLAAGLGILVFGEAGVDGLVGMGVSDTVPAALLLVSGRFADGKLVVAYPLLPWLAVMMLGWVLGRTLLGWRERGEDVERRAAGLLAGWGAVGLVGFVGLRAVDAYGNMWMHRESAGLLQWLHVSKYPPSLAFMGLELGLVALLLAALFRVGTPNLPSGGLLHTYGQTALFYYLLHVHVLALVAAVLGWTKGFGVEGAYLGAAGIVLVLYPVARRYQSYKAEHPNGWAQFV